MRTKYSVLMSVYNKENPIYLSQSLDSIFSQVYKPSEVVLVEDGLLNNKLEDKIKKYELYHRELVVVRLLENVGLGRALNEGLKYCSNELVVRMDSDDISRSDRMDRLISFMENNLDIDVCSSWVDEFVDDISNVVSTRKVPSTHEEIVNFIKSRNPINHPAVIFKKSAVEKSGGYKHFPLFEDWYLWARMMVNGCKFANIQESLLLFRTSKETFKRRGGWKYAKDSARFQRELYKMGLISLLDMIKASIIRGGVYMMPNRIREYIYMKVLRS